LENSGFIHTLLNRVSKCSFLAECQNDLKSKSNNISSNWNQEQNVDLNGKVLPGRTESSITIVRKYPNELTNKKTTNIDQTFVQGMIHRSS
jgi:hypothetical protein